MRETSAQTQRQAPVAFRLFRKCAIFLVLGAIMGGMLIAGLCKKGAHRREKGER